MFSSQDDLSDGSSARAVNGLSSPNSLLCGVGSVKKSSKLRKQQQQQLVSEQQQLLDESENEPECGISAQNAFSKRIIGGERAKFAELPWQVRKRQFLHIPSSKKPSIKRFFTSFRTWETNLCRKKLKKQVLKKLV